MNPFTLYFDGDCHLCSREISLLQRLSPGNIRFIDIHTIESFNDLPSKEAMLKRLHLRSDHGEWILGLNAIIKIWSQTRFGFLVKILALPGIRHIAEYIYRHWADRRYCKRYQVCNSGIQ